MARVCNYLYLYIKRKFFYPTGGSHAPKFNMIHQIIKAVKFGWFNNNKKILSSFLTTGFGCMPTKEEGKFWLTARFDGHWLNLVIHPLGWPVSCRWGDIFFSIFTNLCLPYNRMAEAWNFSFYGPQSNLIYKYIKFNTFNLVFIMSFN